jgi:hypothetical protein
VEGNGKKRPRESARRGKMEGIRAGGEEEEGKQMTRGSGMTW